MAKEVVPRLSVQIPPDVDHADRDGSSAVFGESLTWTCHHGYTSAETGEGQFSLTCASDGSFIGQGALLSSCLF